MALPQYTYDPMTQQYALVGQPAAQTGTGGFGGFFSGIGELLQHMFNKNDGASTVPRFTYDPASQQYTKLASGGPVMNSGLAAAQQTQSMGRGNDSMLVHMTPREVAGLQGIAMSHGGSLTINPKTGLPEAGFLSSILPMVAGAALTAATGGAAAPWMIGLGVGGLTGLATGSLKSGIMAGLGAFGGAGLGSALSAAGATSPAITGTPLALGEAGAGVGAQALTESAAIQSANAANAAAQAAQQAVLENAGSQAAADNAFRQTYMNQVANYNAPSLSNLGSGFSQMGQGISALGTDAGRAAFMKDIGGFGGLISSGGAAASPIIAEMNKPVAMPVRHAYIRPYTYNANPQGNEPGFEYRTGAPGESTAELRYFNPTYTALEPYRADQGPRYAEGGSVRKKINRFDEDLYNFVDFRKDKAMQESAKKMFAAGGAINPDYNMETGGLAAFSDRYAMGGLTAFAKGGASAPRYLSGGGDGMSDSIKANIDGKQEARLADGEFVVPADVVSHLGNGSSNAGAKRLHAMMDRIRQARTGKSKQAPQVNVNKYMPA